MKDYVEGQVDEIVKMESFIPAKTLPKAKAYEALWRIDTNILNDPELDSLMEGEKANDVGFSEAIPEDVGRCFCRAFNRYLELHSEVGTTVQAMYNVVQASSGEPFMVWYEAYQTRNIDVFHRAMVRALETGKSKALALGTMLYFREPIVKQYWKARVMTTRFDKRKYFDPAIYTEWLTEIYGVLTGTHPVFPTPTWGYKPDEKTFGKKHAVSYDTARSFRAWFASYALKGLARWIKEQDQKEEGNDYSLDAGLEREEGGGNRFDAEIAQNNPNKIEDPELSMEYKSIEDSFYEMSKMPSLTEPLCYNTKKGPQLNPGKVNAIDVMIGSTNTQDPVKGVGDLAKRLNCGTQVINKGLEAFTSAVNSLQIDPQVMMKYLKSYAPVAHELLKGNRVTFDGTR